jgi:hypothetical protein
MSSIMLIGEVRTEAVRVCRLIRFGPPLVVGGLRGDGEGPVLTLLATTAATPSTETVKTRSLVFIYLLGEIKETPYCIMSFQVGYATLVMSTFLFFRLG